MYSYTKFNCTKRGETFVTEHNLEPHEGNLHEENLCLPNLQPKATLSVKNNSKKLKNKKQKSEFKSNHIKHENIEKKSSKSQTIMIASDLAQNRNYNSESAESESGGNCSIISFS